MKTPTVDCLGGVGWDQKWAASGGCRASIFPLPTSGCPGGRLELTGSLLPSTCQPGVHAGQAGWPRGKDAIGDGQALCDLGDMLEMWGLGEGNEITPRKPLPQSRPLHTPVQGNLNARFTDELTEA